MSKRGKFVITINNDEDHVSGNNFLILLEFS